MLAQSSVELSVSKKRSHDEAEELPSPEVGVETLQVTLLPTPTSPPSLQASPQSCRPLSPAISVESSALSDAQTLASSKLQATPPSATGPGPAKKQKLTFTQKEVEKARKQSEKDSKKAQEAERKRKQKLAKEEEREAAKRQRELDKAEKQKAKSAEKQEKEDAKRMKDEEKKRKERSQLRLGYFFQKPVTGEALDESPQASCRRSPVISLGGPDDHENEMPLKASPPKKSDGKCWFLPFFVPQNVKLAPVNQFARDANLANMAVSRLDTGMKQEQELHTEDLVSTFKSKKRKRCQKPRCTMQELVESIQGESKSPIDLTGEATSPRLSDVPYKILSFREDVRPPFKGTYTRVVSPKSALKLSRHPFARQLPGTNYEYDSEAEWEPPNEDDEDLESGDDESDVGEEGEEDMDGFLDDEDDLGRRKQVVGDMTPISSGLCWANTNDEKASSLDEFRMQTLSDEHVLPIDPFSTAYWPKAQHVPKQPALQPPRLPLSSLNPNWSPSMTPPSVKGEGDDKTDPLCQKPALSGPQATAAAKPLKLAPEEVLPAFKQAVTGSDLTKVGLIEILKKQ